MVALSAKKVNILDGIANRFFNFLVPRRTFLRRRLVS